MLEPDHWDNVLSRITGTIYRGTERISSNRLLDLLGVDGDPVTRQKVGKRSKIFDRGLGPCVSLSWPPRCRQAHSLPAAGVSPTPARSSECATRRNVFRRRVLI